MLHMEYWSFSRVAVDRFVTCRGLGVTVARRRRSVVLIPARHQQFTAARVLTSCRDR